MGQGEEDRGDLGEEGARGGEGGGEERGGARGQGLG